GRELQRIVGTLPVGKSVDIRVNRDGKEKTVSVTLQEQPEKFGLVSSEDENPSPPSRDEESVTGDKVGLSLTDVTPELAKGYGYKDDVKGAFISEVQRGSIGEDVGLQSGLLIVEIDKKPVVNAAEAKEALQKARLDRGILLRLQLPEKLGGGVALKVLKSET